MKKITMTLLLLTGFTAAIFAEGRNVEMKNVTVQDEATAKQMCE